MVKLANPIFERKEELTKRPVQVAMLSFMLNHSRSSLENITEVPKLLFLLATSSYVHSKKQRLRVEVEERDELLDLIEEAEDWLNAKVKEQEQKQPHEVRTPTYTHTIRKGPQLILEIRNLPSRASRYSRDTLPSRRCCASCSSGNPGSPQRLVRISYSSKLCLPLMILSMQT